LISANRGIHLVTNLFGLIKACHGFGRSAKSGTQAWLVKVS
jgi:hypothetical protein